MSLSTFSFTAIPCIINVLSGAVRPYTLILLATTSTHVRSIRSMEVFAVRCAVKLSNTATIRFRSYFSTTLSVTFRQTVHDIVVL